MKEIENNEWNVIGEMPMSSVKKPENDITKKIGIYKIINKIDGKYYIGSSKNIFNRWYRHKCDLLKQKHHNIYLTRAVNLYGIENFYFVIIKELENFTDKDILIEEQKYLDIAKNDNVYNLSFVAGKVEMTDEIKEKISKALKVRIGLKGKLNPNFGKSRPLEIKKILSKKFKGKNNPFYGKKHTQKSKEKIGICGTKNHNYDSSKYTFFNLITKKLFIGTRNEFYTKFKLNPRCIRRLIRGQYKHYKKWILNDLID